MSRRGRCQRRSADFGLASRGITTALANRGAPKAPTIPAQPSGLGSRTCEAKALKARSISIPGITLVEFGPVPWPQQLVFFLETPLNGLMAQCGTSILRSMISEIGPRRWRLGLFVGALNLGALPEWRLDSAQN